MKNKITEYEFDHLILKLYDNYKEVPINTEQIIKSIKEKNYKIYFKLIFNTMKKTQIYFFKLGPDYKKFKPGKY